MEEKPNFNTELAVVNTNFDTNNIVSMHDEEIRERLVTTLDSCIEVLKSHCGPLSGYALLINHFSAGEDTNPSLFTRDGIKIMNSVSFMAPLERYLKDLLCYIGERVDGAAHDGTTTSMLWSALLLKEIIENQKSLQNYHLTMFHINTAVNELFTGVLEKLKRYTFNLNRCAGVSQDTKLSEAEKVIAGSKVGFMQALSSSGGNVELATAMKQIMERSPAITWEYMTFKNSVNEEGKLFRVRTDPYDFRIACVGDTRNDLTEAYGTEFIRENATVFVSYEAIVQGSMTYEVVMHKFIGNFTQDSPLVIIAPKFDMQLINFVDDLNKIRGSLNKISLWQYSSNELYNGKAYNWMLRVLPAIAGAESFDPDNDDNITDKHLFKAKKVWWHNTYMEFYGIVPPMEEGSCVHPFYAHFDTAPEFYKGGVETLEHQLEVAKHSHEANKKVVDTYVEALNLLTTVRRPTLEVGGTTHDQALNLLVAEDVLGAIMSSTTRGFLINGPMALAGAIHDLAAEQTDKGSTPTEENVAKFKSEILAMMAHATDDILITVYPAQVNTTELTKRCAADPNLYVNSLSCVDAGINDDIEPAHFADFIGGISKLESLDNASAGALEVGTTYPVLQPVRITEEMLRRVQELVIKFISTDKIVVSGGVKVNEDK